MIKRFPNFEKLKLEQRRQIENFIEHFPPYSDFNFTSLWTYNTEDTIEVCFLNDNLVVKFLDYLDNSQFYSFLGKTKIKSTTGQLLDHSIQKNLQPYLKLVPETVVKELNKVKHSYNVAEDKDNYDYIVSAEAIALLHPLTFKRKRYLVERFKRKYPEHKIKLLDLNDKKLQQEIFDLFKLWEKKAGRIKEQSTNELEAIKRLFDGLKQLKIYSLGIYLNNQLVAFNSFELAHARYGFSSFQKADKSLTGVYAVLTYEATKYLYQLGCQFVNHEQDLGIEGLKLSKGLWKPTHFLKKYIIKLKQ